MVYWTMVPPQGHPKWYTHEEEDIVNRCPKESTYEYRLEHGALPEDIEGSKMSSDLKANSLLLSWSRHIPSGQIQDPLGLNLRGLARFANQLLFCITSITPRARYYSFLPWCVYDWQLREQGQPNASTLRDGITFRERGFVLSCVVHHFHI
jgi:hypothetical protein